MILCQKLYGANHLPITGHIQPIRAELGLGYPPSGGRLLHARCPACGSRKMMIRDRVRLSSDPRRAARGGAPGPG
jgi:hypothetical protein